MQINEQVFIEDYGALTRFGVEEFVTDNVIILRNILEDEKRRTIEILKFRRTLHQKDEYPFTVIPQEGSSLFRSPPYGFSRNPQTFA